jgi:hypothetical protein
VPATLAFKLPYAEAILRGEKVQTIRAKRPTFSVGDPVAATCRWGKPPFAVLRIKSITELGIEDLDDDIASADGFADRHELRKAITDIYPDSTALYAIAFSLDSSNPDALGA